MIVFTKNFFHPVLRNVYAGKVVELSKKQEDYLVNSGLAELKDVPDTNRGKKPSKSKSKSRG